ncbi:MAG: hypothetical protein WBI63_04260 [Coriobacteriia bacterium]
MKRIITLALATVLGLAAVALGGCAATNANMESSDMGVWGYVVADKNAQLDAAADQPGGDRIVVDRVLSPEPAWLVVHLEVDGKPGMRVGLAHIDKGESTDIVVPLEDVTTDDVIVALHADRGTPETFDFDMEKATSSFDRPFFVNEKELALVVTVR